MMRQRDKVGAKRVGSAIQEPIACIARALLEIRRVRVESPGARHLKLDAEPGAHLADKVFIALGLERANPMVQVSSLDSHLESLAKFEQSMHQRNRISAAGQRNEDRRAPANRSAL